MNKLQAVQEIVDKIGLNAASALDTGGSSDMGVAERWLDREEMAVQAEGWHYNTRRRTEFSPTLYTFDNASWTEASKTLQQTGKFANATSGQTLTILVGGVPGDYVVDSLVSNDAVILTESMNGGGGNIASGISGQAKTNAIILPDYVLETDTNYTDEWRDMAKRGRRLLDLDNNTTQFSESVTVEYIERVPFACIPPQIQRYMLFRAALEFAAQRKSDQYPAIKRQMESVKTQAKNFNARCKDANFLRRPDSLSTVRSVSRWTSQIDVMRRA